MSKGEGLERRQALCRASEGSFFMHEIWSKLQEYAHAGDRKYNFEQTPQSATNNHSNKSVNHTITILMFLDQKPRAS